MTALNPKSTALLVVHLQHDIVSAGTAFGALFNRQVVERDVLAKCNTAMKIVREAGGLVVPLRIAFAPDYSNLVPSLPLLQMVAQAGCLKDGETGAEIVPEIQVGADDVVLTHQRPGPFTNSKLHEILQGNGIEDVVVCGVATNASVEGAVRQASDLGYSTYVLTDASSAADASSHEASIGSLGLFAQMLSVKELSGAMEK